MDPEKRRDKQVTICILCSGAFECARTHRPGEPAAGLLYGPDTSRRAQERGADGGENGSGPDGGAAPVVAAFCRCGVLVGCEGVGQGARDGAALDGAARAYQGVDHRRHSFPETGKAFSEGMQHQYCGQLGKEADCQVAVSLSVASHAASLPVAYRLYLPKEWIGDTARRKKAGVPRDLSFQTRVCT